MFQLFFAAFNYFLQQNRPLCVTLDEVLVFLNFKCLLVILVILGAPFIDNMILY